MSPWIKFSLISGGVFLALVGPVIAAHIARRASEQRLVLQIEASQKRFGDAWPQIRRFLALEHESLSAGVVRSRTHVNVVIPPAVSKVVLGVESEIPFYNSDYHRNGDAALVITNMVRGKTLERSNSIMLVPERVPEKHEWAGTTWGGGGGYERILRFGEKPAILSGSVIVKELIDKIGSPTDVIVFDGHITMEVKRLTWTEGTRRFLEPTSDLVKSKLFRVYVFSDPCWADVQQAGKLLTEAEQGIKNTNSDSEKAVYLWYFCLFIIFVVVIQPKDAAKRSA